MTEQRRSGFDQATEAYTFAATIVSTYKGWQAGQRVLNATGDRYMARSVIARTTMGWQCQLLGIPFALLSLGAWIVMPYATVWFGPLTALGVILAVIGRRLLRSARERTEAALASFNEPPPIPGVLTTDTDTTPVYGQWGMLRQAWEYNKHKMLP